MFGRRGVLMMLMAGSVLAEVSRGADLGAVPRYGVREVTFQGPEQGPTDTPARDVQLAVTFRHESGTPTVRVAGFWDGDGQGGTQGHIFKVRFCPTAVGRWTIAKTESNRDELREQREGDTLVCIASEHPGFWIADGPWYRRSDGSHPYIVGNTHYTLLSRQTNDGPAGSSAVQDIRENARYFSKLRFTLMADRYPDPKVKPFLDDRGKPTDDGRFSYRPNPQWFHDRADPAIAEGHRVDLICDLILCGPDTRESRSTLADDPRPWLTYIAARYGSYPNVWLCLANEWDIKQPQYTAGQIRAAGDHLRTVLPYPTPVSVHGAPGDWKKELHGRWHDHVILQDKIKRLGPAADVAARNRRATGQPVVNDENAYQGRGDGFSEADTVEGCFGTFLGGGYASTGEKHGGKLGQYFWGDFDAKTHTAAPRLGYLRDSINRAVPFWRLAPLPLEQTPFKKVDSPCRVLGQAGEDYVLGSDRAMNDVEVTLPDGAWTITQVDLMAMTTRTLARHARGRYRFETPDSRAVLTHFAREESE